MIESEVSQINAKKDPDFEAARADMLQELALSDPGSYFSTYDGSVRITCDELRQEVRKGTSLGNSFVRHHIKLREFERQNKGFDLKCLISWLPRMLKSKNKKSD